MTMKKLIRIDEVKVIDDIKILSYDLMRSGLSGCRGIETSSHIKYTLILFNWIRIRVPKFLVR